MESFNKLLSEATNNVLTSLLGESISELVYGAIERYSQLRREEIGEKTEAFFDQLGKLVGSEGARVIQAVSLRHLSRRLEGEYEEVETYLSFLDKLNELKFALLAPSVNAERPGFN